MNIAASIDPSASAPKKFENPDLTAKGEERARVPLGRLDTLWINTGTLCNITCRSCYIESSPTNDRLVYVTPAEIRPFLDEARALGTREIGFTGGEPFLNPDMLELLGDALDRGFEVLVLTNAMLPMQRPAIKKGLLAARARHGDRLAFRISLDHHTRELHETERGVRTFDIALTGLDWLSSNGFPVAIAGRTCWNETDRSARDGYAALINGHGWAIDPENDKQLMLLPEMDGQADVPEISTSCWRILKREPHEMMCASSRMIVKRKGADAPVVLPCTLLPYEPAFEMGSTLKEAAQSNGGMFDKGAVKLCHVHCAKFCVLGGGRCT